MTTNLTSRSAAAQPGPSAPWTRWVIAAMVAVVLLYGADIVAHPLPSAVSELFQKFAASAIFFPAALLCAVRSRAHHAERAAWWLFALALVLWGSASVYYSVVLWDRATVPIPSLADGLWIAFYVPAYGALALLLRKRSAGVGRGVWLDAIVGGLGVGGAAAASALQSVLDSSHTTTIAAVTDLAYPVGDLGLLVLVVAAITVTGWKLSGVWRWIAPAFICFAVADSIYAIEVANHAYATGTLLDLGWPLAALLVGVAAWRPEGRARRAERRGTRVALPALFGVTALSLLIVDHFVRMNPLALTLASGSMLVLLLRLYLTVRENARWLVHSRREASTDALTELGNRRRLAADLARHVGTLDPRHPLMLTLFDLNRFKAYNDTFGHPAGDELLKRLGERLRAAVAGQGTAYRMGGDEFCALWVLPSVADASRVAGQAAAALAETGPGFAVDCAHGSVLLPTEAGGAEDALRIADRRMYTRKDSGRASAGQQSSSVLVRALAERDAELGLHVGDVADMACEIAEMLGVPPEDMELMRQTALLHDAGKVAIPDEILGKPGPLTETEVVFMQQHTIIGERIISAAPALERVARLVRSTHERYDGDGYPDGLAGAQIPLICRIVSVCDTYDALVTTRAYRPAVDAAAALEELHRCAGTQFDPEVVAAFTVALAVADPLPAKLLAHV